MIAGVDVTANQDEVSDDERFQLEYDQSTKRWYIRTMKDRYWTLETGGGIQANGDKRCHNLMSPVNINTPQAIRSVVDV